MPEDTQGKWTPNNPYGVKPGQIWADNDPRTPRTLTITEVDSGFAYAVSSSGRKSRIRLTRFRPNSTGYRLIGWEHD